MSRTTELGRNVVSYLRDKLPRYDIDLEFMFDMSQKDCDMPSVGLDITKPLNIPKPSARKHPLKRNRKNYHFSG